MSPRTILVLMLAAVSGISAVVGVRRIIGNTDQTPKVETVKAVVATQEIAPGDLILRSSLKISEFLKGSVPAGAITKIEDVVGRASFVPIAADELVLETKLAPKGVGGLEALIPVGKRAVCIQIANVAAGHAGLIVPKNKVDVLFTSTDQGPDDATGGGATVMLLQNVEILAVDRRLYVSSDTKTETSEIRSVTLLVTPDQANMLDLAQNKGILHLALRSRKDELTAETRPALLKDLRFQQEKPEPPPTPTAVAEPVRPRVVDPLRIRTLRGRSTGLISFPAP